VRRRSSGGDGEDAAGHRLRRDVRLHLVRRPGQVDPAWIAILGRAPVVDDVPQERGRIDGLAHGMHLEPRQKLKHGPARVASLPGCGYPNRRTHADDGERDDDELEAADGRKHGPLPLAEMASRREPIAKDSR